MANFYGRVSDAAGRFPTQHAVELQTPDALLPTTYQQLTQEAAEFASWLNARGVAADDRIAILGDNTARWISAYLGILRLGAIAVPLDTAYKSSQIRTVLDNSGARLIFTTPRYAEAVQAACADLAPHPEVRLLDDPRGEAASAPPVVDRNTHDAAVILYTSGTTSDPKGVVLTHGNLEAERLAAYSVVTLTDTDAVLGVLPLFHSLAQMANLLLPLTGGARVVFLQSVSSTALLEALQQRRITIFACVPQFFYLIHERVMGEVAKAGPLRRSLFRVLLRTNGWLREHTGWNPGRRWFGKVHAVLGTHMRFLVTGGSRFDPTIGRDLYDMGFALLNAYGLTETSGGATIMRPGDRYSTSVGQALRDVEIRIAPRERALDGGEDDQQDGEVLIRGPIVMREYYRRPDATAEALRDGWLHTGDLGRLDAAGRLYITGRRKEMIVLASGKNLYPEEIEAHYREAPVIKELCVLGLSRPGEPIGERLHAVIVPDEQVLKERGVVNVQQLVRFELESRSVHLPAHKRILTYDIWIEPLPRTTTGKVRRHLIEKRLREQTVVAAEGEQARLSDDEEAWLTIPAHADAMRVITTQLKRENIRPDAHLDLDLALDSMERVELLTALERRHGRRVTPETRVTIVTARQLVDAVLAATPAEANVAADWGTLLQEPVDPELTAQLQRLPVLRAVLFFVIVRTIAGVLYLLTRGKVMDTHHLPAQGPFILSPNHQSYIDGFLLLSALPFRTLREIFAVGAAEYYQTPFMRWFARMTNVIPVDPDAHLERALKAGAAGLRMGKVLMLFPEGERSIDGELKTFKKGAAILSGHCQAPIVPVAMDGLFQLWPRSRPFNWRGLLPWRAAPVVMQFGPSIVVTPGKYAEGTQAVRDAIARMLNALRRRF
jgi:long-chain acyl-CoA synthetase